MYLSSMSEKLEQHALLGASIKVDLTGSLKCIDTKLDLVLGDRDSARASDRRMPSSSNKHSVLLGGTGGGKSCAPLGPCGCSATERRHEKVPLMVAAQCTDEAPQPTVCECALLDLLQKEEEELQQTKISAT